MKKKSFEIMEKFYKSLIYGENLLNLPKDRLSVYQTLVFNNIEDSCSRAFPITKGILIDSWEEIMKDFLKNHKFSSPYLWEVPKEFIKFLKDRNFFKNKEFLYELMIYEWIEIELFNEDLPISKRDFNWYANYKITNSARIFNFKYPVHTIQQIGIENIEKFKGNYFLIIYQNPENNEVEFFEISQFLYDILNNLDNKLFDTVSKICNKYNLNFEDVILKLEEFFELLLRNRILS